MPSHGKRAGLDKARQYAEGLNELEVKVEEATNSDKWGPHGSLMQGECIAAGIPAASACATTLATVALAPSRHIDSRHHTGVQR